MSNLIRRQPVGNENASSFDPPGNNDATLGAIIERIAKEFSATEADAPTTWLSFAVMTGHAAFPLYVEVTKVANVVNEVGTASMKAGLVDVQFYLQRRTTRDAAGLEAIYGFILDIDRKTTDPLLESELAGVPTPNFHFQSPNGFKPGYIFDHEVTEPVFTEMAMRLGLAFDGIDPRSWSTSQAQRVPTCLRTTKEDGIVLVERAAYLSNPAPLTPTPEQVPFPGRVRRALGASYFSPVERQRVREHLEELGIPAPESPGANVYDACPDSSEHSSKCCYVNVNDDGRIHVVCLAGHGGEGRRQWSETDLLRLTSGESYPHTGFNVLEDLPVTWAAVELIHHRLRAWSEEEQRAAVRVITFEKARNEAPSPEFAPEMLALFQRRVSGDRAFGPVHLYFDVPNERLAYEDAAGRTCPINCQGNGPNTKSHMHECAATAAHVLVTEEKDGRLIARRGWSATTSSLMNKAVVGQRHALKVLGVPAMVRHTLPVAFVEEHWDIEPGTKVLTATIPFTFPSDIQPVAALDFFLQLYREGRLPLATENDVRLFVACIASPLLRHVAPGLLGAYWFVGPPGAGKDFLAELPPMIWSRVNPYHRRVKFDLNITDDLEIKRSVAMSANAIYARAKEAGKRVGMIEQLIRFTGTDMHTGRNLNVPECDVPNTFTVVADSAEDVPDRREISRRTVMLSVVEIADEVSKGKVREDIRNAAPRLLLDLLHAVESQPVEFYSQQANTGTRPIIPVALARLFGATLPEVRGEDLSDLFELMRDFTAGRQGKEEGDSQRKKAVDRNDKESLEAKMFPSYRLTYFIDCTRSQAGYREFFMRFGDKAAGLTKRIMREVGYADIRTGKKPYLDVRIGSKNHAFKLVRSNRNFILLPSQEYEERMAAVRRGDTSVDAGSEPNSLGPDAHKQEEAPNGSSASEFTFDDDDVLDAKGGTP